MDAITENLTDVKLISAKVTEAHEWTHNWTIDNFNQTFSEIFGQSFASAMNTKWRLSANSRHLSNGVRSFGLYIQNDNNYSERDGPSVISFVKCDIFITNIYGKDIHFGSKEICLKNNLTKVIELYFDSIADPKFGFVCGQRLNLVLKLEVRGQRTFGKDQFGQKELNDCSQIVPIGSQFNRKWRLNCNSKTKLLFVVNSKTFFVNRQLMTTHSKMIARVVSAHNECDTFRLHGISAETFEDILYYLNFGKVRDLKRKASELLIAAKDFGFDGLKDICLEYISENLSVDNVIKYLKLGHTMGSEALVRKTWLYIDKNYSQMKDRKDWTQNFSLILKVGQNLLSQKCLN